VLLKRVYLCKKSARLAEEREAGMNVRKYIESTAKEALTESLFG